MLLNLESVHYELEGYDKIPDLFYTPRVLHNLCLMAGNNIRVTKLPMGREVPENTRQRNARDNRMSIYSPGNT